MLTRLLDNATRVNLQELVRANFACRDELYSAAQSLEDEDRRQVCRWLAEHLADHAIYIQQVLEQRGADVPGPPALEKANKAKFKRARLKGGANAVLEVAERSERALKETYDRASRNTPDQEATDIMRRQRQDVEFAERVLRSMRTDGPR